MNRSTRTLAALTSAAALTVAGMSPASAAYWAYDDAVGDVVSYTYDESTDTDSGPNPQPANTITDITRFTASHKARRVVLTATLRDITAASGTMMYQVRTGQRTYDAVQRLGTSREKGPVFGLYRNDQRTRVRCSGARTSVDRTSEEAMVSIPRSCLGRPSWVRVGGHAYNLTESDSGYEMVFDVALHDGSPERQALSPRIRRG
jgi:hypothetical protein